MKNVSKKRALIVNVSKLHYRLDTSLHIVRNVHDAKFNP